MIVACCVHWCESRPLIEVGVVHLSLLARTVNVFARTGDEDEVLSECAA